eukprot:CAMPEP_0174276064 /NCGR_PEP_ID=MMETSP0439-20130205/60181_1 /TAXON_ID=0 /ORGANISM="Stereomyxa ramosa, Strain Chinc5" /LENGTH=382 /DNA_ID=CAMNT_0015368253 /DNA_START=63 /DNA_END=1212 /DNA_ORIENTATION=+
MKKRTNTVKRPRATAKDWKNCSKAEKALMKKYARDKFVEHTDIPTYATIANELMELSGKTDSGDYVRKATPSQVRIRLNSIKAKTLLKVATGLEEGDTQENTAKVFWGSQKKKTTTVKRARKKPEPVEEPESGGETLSDSDTECWDEMEQTDDNWIDMPTFDVPVFLPNSRTVSTEKPRASVSGSAGAPPKKRKRVSNASNGIGNAGSTLAPYWKMYTADFVYVFFRHSGSFLMPKISPKIDGIVVLLEFEAIDAKSFCVEFDEARKHATLAPYWKMYTADFVPKIDGIVVLLEFEAIDAKSFCVEFDEARKHGFELPPRFYEDIFAANLHREHLCQSFTIPFNQPIVPNRAFIGKQITESFVVYCLPLAVDTRCDELDVAF